jgi:hypothetical protein
MTLSPIHPIRLAGKLINAARPEAQPRVIEMQTVTTSRQKPSPGAERMRRLRDRRRQGECAL